ncbi:MAG: DUF1127 domain-containing protein [Rhizobiaceae bacterium]|nr:DUF1127 domain-containing protein [Rhizobiaceae bacterium]
MNAICQREISCKNPLPLSIREKSAPDLYSSIGGIISRWVIAIKHQYALRKQRNIDRQAFSRMFALDDHILADIGITRDDLTWASKLPLSQNASCVLNKIARQKSG